jgi:hypothetical protein
MTGQEKCDHVLEGLTRGARSHEAGAGLDSRTPRAPDLQESRGEAVSEGRLATYAHASIGC